MRVMTSQSRPLLVLACLVLVTSVVTSSDQDTWQPSKWLDQLGESMRFQEGLSRGSELSLKQETQCLEQSKELEVQKLKLKLVQEKMASLESDHKRELEEVKLRLKSGLESTSAIEYQLRTQISDIEKKIQSNKDEIFRVSTKTNQNEGDINNKTSLNTNRIEGLEAKTSNFDSKEFPEIKSKLNQQEVTLVSISTFIKRNLRNISGLDMIQLGKNFYHFSNDKLSWPAARTFCRSHGLELAALETQEENKLVKEQWQIEHRDDPTWLDGTNEGHEGQWLWSSSGQALNYTDWLPNSYTSIRKGMHYMCLWFYDANQNWGSCGNGAANLYYICEATL